MTRTNTSAHVSMIPQPDFEAMAPINGASQTITRRGRTRKLTMLQLRGLYDVLNVGACVHGFPDNRWLPARVVTVIAHLYGVTYHPNYVKKVLIQMQQAVANDACNEPFFRTTHIALYQGDAETVLAQLPSASVDCIVTSPPYYGQRDYGVPNQIGLEAHPQQYIERLVAVFSAARRVLKPTGSLWVNLGDTYWSGKGRPQGNDPKQPNRRFQRPQDASGPRPLCRPKQLLLIPHRFAIAMQEAGWIVRNDNVWYKVNPTPDPVEDRCASAHEYMFHFVLQRRYHFDSDAVAVPSQGEKATKAPPSVWKIQSAPTFKKHIAVFPEELVRIPIQATLPKNGVLLDPFCGSATALSYALAQGGQRRVIGIDISNSALEEAQAFLLATPD